MGMKSKKEASSTLSTVSVLFASVCTVLLILATVLVVFPDLKEIRVSIILFISKLYYRVGEFRQLQWDEFLDFIGEDDEQKLMLYGSSFILIFFYWFIGGIYTFLDVTNKPDAMRRYKIQPGTNEPVSSEKLFKAVALILFNQTVISIPCIFFVSKLFHLREAPPVRQLPSIFTAFIHLVVFLLVEEIVFFYSHWALHHRNIYKYIHKQHHEWTAPIAIIAIYAHPLEHILSNLFPSAVGVFVSGAHISTIWLWLALAVASSLTQHSGYHIPFLISPERHDFHHLKFNNCYGALGILDKLHGTDTQFRQSLQFKRHFILTSLNCSRDFYPDPEEKVS